MSWGPTLLQCNAQPNAQGIREQAEALLDDVIFNFPVREMPDENRPSDLEIRRAEVVRNLFRHCFSRFKDMLEAGANRAVLQQLYNILSKCTRFIGEIEALSEEAAGPMANEFDANVGEMMVGE